MSTPDWWQLAPAVSAIFSAIAACIAAVNAWATKSNASRQHAIGYATEVTKWGSDCLAIYKVVADAHMHELTAEQKYNGIRDAVNGWIDLIGRAAFLLPSSESSELTELENAIDLGRVDCSRMKSDGYFPIDDLKYRESKNRFILAVRDSLPISRRFRDAKYYIK